jgi:hypothetical protein
MPKRGQHGAARTGLIVAMVERRDAAAAQPDDLDAIEPQVVEQR